MHNHFKYLLVVMMGVLLVMGCSGGEKAEQQPAMEEKVTTDGPIDITPDMLTTHIDLVCGMDLNKHAIKDTTIYKDQLYGFCNTYCKEKFLEDPEAAIAKMEKE